MSERARIGEGMAGDWQQGGRRAQEARGEGAHVSMLLPWDAGEPVAGQLT